MASKSANGALKDSEASTATRAAWLHFAGGLTQSEVAKRLGLTSLKAHRLIARASREGLIKVYIDGEISECVQLEEKLSSRYGLEFCQVVPDLDDSESDSAALPLKSLGMAGAQYLKLALERDKDQLIGVGHGRTLAACIDYLPRTSAGKTRFVSLLGGLTRKFAANPHDVIHRLAERTGAEAYVMPVPFFANSIEDRSVLLNQRGISDIFELGKQANLLLVGIGTAEPGASLVETGMIERKEINEIKRKGGCGELLGHFFDRTGAAVETELSSRTLSLSRDELLDRRMVAVAGGTEKTDAIRSILKSGFLKGLITNESTASALAGQLPAPTEKSKGVAEVS
ncbi:sugar-binding transcriptional regulator [Denitrobaculum tricleocarpae]|uniref:Sugar-binding transcriptional regulator n=1 Tax=Denitrobaculum tricleocarpae TaxID=2591009 RepID=A0A545U0W0_9PROT|nr:sugar-binding transcriptional regulator [Denitrobaculum tricleocarpae]TQV83084.1 sugar-binding transcriptional regulator [Denitrobaculum tricleocarpae]